MNIKVKLVNEMLMSQTEQCAQRIIHHSQVELILGVQCWFNILRPSSAVHHINKLRKKSSHQ